MGLFGTAVLRDCAVGDGGSVLCRGRRRRRRRDGFYFVLGAEPGAADQQHAAGYALFEDFFFDGQHALLGRPGVEGPVDFKPVLMEKVLGCWLCTRGAMEKE